MQHTAGQGVPAIAVMAKAPQAGRTKTRLVPPLDPAGAAALGAAFLRDTTDNIALVAREVPLAGAIAYAPAGTEALFDGMLAPGTSLLLADGSATMPSRVEGLGRSLFHAMSSLFLAGHSAALLLNSDSPNLPTAYLRRAIAALATGGDQVVLGPAEDGGYYLIGMTEPYAALFEDIGWSTDQVAGQTRARAGALGLRVAELPSWYDVDDRESLERLIVELRAPQPGAYAAPATAECLARLKLLRRTAAR